MKLRTTEKIVIAELQSCGCGATFLDKLQNCNCGSASFKLRNCNYGLKKSCAFSPLVFCDCGIQKSSIAGMKCRKALILSPAKKSRPTIHFLKDFRSPVSSSKPAASHAGPVRGAWPQPRGACGHECTVHHPGGANPPSTTP
jgi:hypothetical protein